MKPCGANRGFLESLGALLVCAFSFPVFLFAEPATEQEKRELLSLRADQGSAVVALNETIATAQAAQRARCYLDGNPGAFPFAQEIAQLEQQLQQLEERFTILYQAHFGPYPGGGGEPPARKAALGWKPEAQTLAADPKRRDEERAQLIRSYTEARAAVVALQQQMHDALVALQNQLPHFHPAPGFANKPPATIRADGTPTGILFGNAGGGTYHSARINPAIHALGFDYETGGYDPYDGGRFQNQAEGETYAEQLARSGANGQQSTTIIACAVDRMMANPAYLWKKWLDAPSRDASLPVFATSGVRQGWKGEQFFPLDFYHPSVRGMMAEYLADAGARYKRNPHVLWHVTAWEPRLADRSLPGNPLDIRTPAGLLDFRRHLKRKFHTIERLNAAWRSRYASFDDIPFPTDIFNGPEEERKRVNAELLAGRCTPLLYEFHRWVKESFARWLAFCYRELKRADPAHAIAVSPAEGAIDGYLSMGRDSFLWAEQACDVYACEIGGTLEEVFEYSLKRLTRRTTASNEFIWNEKENYGNPPEEVIRAAGRRNLWRMIAWGRSAITLYGPNDTYGGGSYDNFMVFESGYQLLRPCGGVIETTRRRLRSMEDIWMRAPVVEPLIAMLKPSTAMVCGPVWQTVESAMEHIHPNLYSRNYHYAFVPEEYLLDGKDNLARYRVLILPWATQLAPGLSEKILAWVKRGGILILCGVAGGYTAYGEKDGVLMKEIFGVSDYPVRYDESARNPVEELTWVLDGDDSIRLASYGKGRALFVPRKQDFANGPALPHFYRLLDEAAPRRAWAEGAPLEMALRERGKQLYVVLINPESRQPATATVHLAGTFRDAVDRGIDRGFPVSLRTSGKGQAFDIVLAPGEGTVIVLTKR
jgi:hypothetical protein